MRYLIAPNAFKGTIPADEAAQLIATEILAISGADCLVQPVADGGDGTCQLLIDSLGVGKIQVWTLNAVGQPVRGYFGWEADRRKAYLDISTASGLGILESYQKDPFSTSTFGTGLLILKAVELGAEEIVLGLGGSATIDLGIGILSALGVFFLDENGREIPAFSPGYIGRLRHIQRPLALPKVKFSLLCDVKNPLLGANGAVPIFGPQKGLEKGTLKMFEGEFENALDVLKRKSKEEWTDLPGYGAAGGVAAGLRFFFETEIKFGAAYFFELIQMEEKVLRSDWLITGEGKYDSQSDQGKASFELLNLAKAHGKKIALITSGQEAKEAGFDLVLELPPLDFSSLNFKEKARENIRGLIASAISEGKLS